MLHFIFESAKLAQDREQDIRHLVARHPHLPSNTLEKLTCRLVEEYVEAIKHPSTRLKSWESAFLSILDHPNFTSKIGDALICLINLHDYNHKNEQRAIIDAIFKHEKLPESTLLQLARDSKKNLYLYAGNKSLLNRSNLTTEFLEILIEELLNISSDDVLNTLSSHVIRSSFDAQELEHQTRQFQSRANHAIAEYIVHPNVLPKRLEQLSTHSDELIRRSVAKNPSTPVPVLQMLATHPTLGDRYAVAQNPSAPPNLLLRFAVDPDESIRKAVAQNIRTSLAILETLADDESPFVRCGLVTNPSTHTAILIRLFGDPVEKVRSSLLDSPNLPTQLLERFADDPSPQLRANAAQHPNTPIHSLVKLAQESYSGIRHTLLTRGASLPETVLSKLAETTFSQIRKKSDQECFHDREDAVMDLLARHPNTPIQILEMFAFNQPVELYQRFGESWFNFLRRAVANNASTPIDILEKIIEDPQSGAREAAQNNLRNRSKDIT